MFLFSYFVIFRFQPETKYWTREMPLSPYSKHSNNNNKHNNNNSKNNNNYIQRRNKARSYTLDAQSNQEPNKKDEKSRTKSLDNSISHNNKKIPQSSQQTPKKETKLKEFCANTIERFWPIRTRRRAVSLDPTYIDSGSTSKYINGSHDNLDRIDEANDVHFVRGN